MKTDQAALIIDWKNNFNNDDKLVPALPFEAYKKTGTAMCIVRGPTTISTIAG